MPRPFLLVWVFALQAHVAQGAQSAWINQPTNFPVTLWGVTYGAGMFVAVGDGGTILTSDDGMRWSRADSPTTRGLFAVARGLDSFVAVGDGGVILTSRDGVSWQEAVDRNAGLARLNGVVWLSQAGSNAFRAAGEAGRFVDGNTSSNFWGGYTMPGVTGWIRGMASHEASSYYVGSDGVSVMLSAGLGVRPLAGSNLEAIARGPEQWVAVGQLGAIWSSLDGSTWSRSRSDSTAHLNGLVSVGGGFVAVGAEGTILSGLGRDLTWRRESTGTTATLRAVAADSSTIVAVGDAGTILRRGPQQAAISVIQMQPASVTAPVGYQVGFTVKVAGGGSYQWRRGGVALPGETSDMLVLPAITAADAGEYSVEVTRSGGVLVSDPAVLTVTPAKHLPVRDPSFKPPAGALSGQVQAILPLADGRVVVFSGSTVIRLLSDGRRDPEYAPTSLIAEYPQLTLQPDGKIVVVGRTLSNGQGLLTLARLHANGGLDTSFVPPDEILRLPMIGSGGLPTGAQIVAQPDGKLLIFVEPGRLWRLLPEGSLDPEFTFSNVGNGQSRGGSIALATDGKIYRAVPYDGLSRLLPNGRRDTTFVSRLPSSTSATFLGSYAFQIFVTADQKVLVNTVTWASTSATSIAHTAASHRVTAQGEVDLTYASQARWLLCPPAADGTMISGASSGGIGVPGLLGPVSDPRRIRLLAPDGALLPELNWGLPSTTSGTYIAAFAADGRLWVGGEFSTFDGVPASGLVRVNRVNKSEVTEPPYIAATWGAPEIVYVEDSTTLKVLAYSDGPMLYEWDPTGAGTDWEDSRIRRTMTPFVTHQPRPGGGLRNLPDSTEGEVWAVRAVNSAGASTVVRRKLQYQRVGFETVSPIGQQVVAAPGRTTRLSFMFPRGTPIRSVVWFKDGVRLERALGGWENTAAGVRVYLDLPAVSEATAGSYAPMITTYFREERMLNAIDVSVGDTSRFANLSVRAHVGTGEQAAVVGFVIPEGRPRSLLLRGIGPTLADFGVERALPWTTLELFAEGSRLVLSVNGVSRPDLFARVGAFPLSRDRGDTSFLASQLAPGSYTVRLSGGVSGVGVGLIELYEADDSSERLLNVSSRVQVGAGAAAGIAGFSITGSSPKRVLLRGSGPALAGFGVSGTLADPRIELRDSAGRLVASNDDWSTQSGTGVSPGADILSLARSVGAFAFSAGSKDAALALTLAPGTYTLSLTGNESGSGIGLLEVYELP